MGHRILRRERLHESDPALWCRLRRCHEFAYGVEHDPINVVSKYRANLKSLRGIYVDCSWRDVSRPFLYRALMR